MRQKDEYTIDDALQSLETMREWGCSADAIETLRSIILTHDVDPVEVGMCGRRSGYVDYEQCTVRVNESGTVNSVEVHEPNFKQTCWLLDKVEEGRQLWTE